MNTKPTTQTQDKNTATPPKKVVANSPIIDSIIRAVNKRVNEARSA